MKRIVISGLAALVLSAGCAAKATDVSEPTYDQRPIVTAPLCAGQPTVIFDETGYTLTCGRHVLRHTEVNGVCSKSLEVDKLNSSEFWEDEGCDYILEKWAWQGKGYIPVLGPVLTNSSSPEETIDPMYNMMDPTPRIQWVITMDTDRHEFDFSIVPQNPDLTAKYKYYLNYIGQPEVETKWKEWKSKQ